MWLQGTLQEGSLLSTPSLVLIVCREFGHGHSDQCDVKIAVAWICISLMFSDVDIFSCDFLKDCELNLTSWNWLNACLLLDSFSMTTRSTFFEGSCFLLIVPGSSWILNAQQHGSSWCYYRKWPQGGSTSSCRMPFFPAPQPPINSLLFSTGIEWISDVVFVSGVQELDSVIHICLFSLGFFFAYRRLQYVQ